ncbi:MAG: response regulator transcription factor [Acutalibacter sp.]
MTSLIIQTLLADDSKTELDVLCYLIKKNNLPLEISTAPNGEAALKMLEETSFDLLVTDIRMPFLDGLSLAGEALRLNPDIKIVISSGYQDFSYAKTAITLGVEEYLLKPIVPDQFLPLIRRLCSEIEAEAQARESDRLKLIYSRNQITTHLISGKLTIAPGDRLPEEIRRLMPESGILILLSADPASRSTLENLKSDVMHLAEKSFHAPVRRLAIEDRLYLFLDFIDTAYQGANSLLKARTLDFQKKLQELYQVEVRVGADVFDAPEKIPEVARRLSAASAAQAQPEEDSRADLTLSHGKIKFLCDYIADHYQENLSLDVLSHITYLNSDYLCRIFKKETGINLMKYIKNFRMNKARQLLESTQQKITAISRAVGYQNCGYFIHSFTEQFGVSPEKYRQQHQTKGE